LKSIKKKAINIPVIEKINAKETFLQDFVKTHLIEIICNHSGKLKRITSYSFSYNTMDNFLLDSETKALAASVEYINTSMNEILNKIPINSQKFIDDILISKIKIDENRPLLGINIINNLSFLISKTISVCKEISIYKTSRILDNVEMIYPKLALTCLRGSKIYNSKVKVFLVSFINFSLYCLIN